MRRSHGLAARAGSGRQRAERGWDGETQTLLARASRFAQEPSEEPEQLPGDVLLGRFQIRRLVARGGMGEVYDVDDAALGARVALKKLRTSVLAHPSALGQFRREVLLARRVTHPNVCRLFEFFISEKEGALPLVFLTMELVEGETLSDYLARTGVAGDEAIPLVQQMVAALAAAHRQGVVHRDFKSSNVMLAHSAEGPRVVVTDFGLACGLRPGETTDLLPSSGMVGSPPYMAPEQVTGGAVSAATDVYALGVVLYEMVTGTLPFVGDNPVASALKRLKAPPERPSARRRGLGTRWDETILRCLEINPAQRFSHVEEVLDSLEDEPVLDSTWGRRMA